jgi:hypothetical protein
VPSRSKTSKRMRCRSNGRRMRIMEVQDNAGRQVRGLRSKVLGLPENGDLKT